MRGERTTIVLAALDVFPDLTLLDLINQGVIYIILLSNLPIWLTGSPDSENITFSKLRITTLLTSINIPDFTSTLIFVAFTTQKLTFN